MRECDYLSKYVQKNMTIENIHILFTFVNIFARYSTRLLNPAWDWLSMGYYG